MPSGRGIEIEGLSKLLRALEKLDEAAKEELTEAAIKAGQPVLEEARLTAPYRTGALAGSIRLAKSARGVKIRAGNARVPYAMPIHFGWQSHNIVANKFLFRAVDRRADEVLAAYQAYVIDIWNRNV